MTIRQPAVAGVFYPANRSALSREVSQLLDEATLHNLSPKVLIAPHAGYIYSGATAAAAYRQLAGRESIISRVVLLGPSHHVPFHGLALPASTVFNTPLGPVNIDTESANQLLTFSQVQVLEAAHELEHSLEVQLPFLQTILNDFQLLPLVVGDASPLAVSEVLEHLWGGPETLIVISTDLSHYHPYEEAQTIDANTVKTIQNLEATLKGEQACGSRPLNGLLTSAFNRNMEVVTLDTCNSGDSAGDHGRVVGYAAFAIQ